MALTLVVNVIYSPTKSVIFVGPGMGPELAEWLVSVRDDPYAFVMGAFPWLQPGTQLEAFDGPMPWAKAQMERIRLGLLTVDGAILEATASGHGIAKSTTVAQLVL